MQSNALDNKVELCEVFVIIGIHEKILCKNYNNIDFMINFT